DIVVGAPCAPRRVGDDFEEDAGIVKVFSGANGRRLFVRAGKEPKQYFGYSVGFVGDLNGDGKDEIIVGSPGFDVRPSQNPDPEGGALANGGKAEVITIANRKRFQILGSQSEGAFGSAVAGIGDVNGDGWPDVVVSGVNERADKTVRPGRVHVHSGRNGDLISTTAGEQGGELFGGAIAAVPDVDGDLVDDVVIGSPERNVKRVRQTGLTLIMRGDLDGEPIFEQVGARKDNLGKSADRAGDRDADGLEEIVVGSFKSSDSGLTGAGEIKVYRGDGELLMAATDSSPQENANFGSSVADLGDITGDRIDDFAVGVPRYDVPADEDGDSTVVSEAGRTVAVSGIDGATLWSVDGAFTDGKLGSSVSGGLDFNHDGTPDALSGAIGAPWQGRRGAGVVSVLSGIDGSLLFEWGGKYGLTTRIFSAGQGRLVGYSVEGDEHNPDASLNGIAGNMSIAVLDDRGRVGPGQVHLAVASGHRGSNGRIAIYEGGRGDRPVDQFDALSNRPPLGVEGPRVGGGVNVAIGNFTEDEDEPQRIVAVQADSRRGEVEVRIFRRFDEQESWFLDGRFFAFERDGTFPLSPSLNVPVEATGGTVAVGDIHDSPGDEIVVGTEGGLPVVRVFSSTGQLLAQWLAYDPVESDGVQVCIGDVAPARSAEIITVPSTGTPLIKVFGGDGERLPQAKTDEDISIVPSIPADSMAGGRACGADVDYDGVQEIIFVPGRGAPSTVQAFESDGTPVAGFDPFELLGPGFTSTDTFVRF
ncbi:MAG: hypothetical protein E4H03_11410, partial [Myxococcales bacterium]